MSYTPYVTAAALKTTLSASGYTGADDDIDQVVITASQAVDKVCDRTFQDLGAQTRYYSPRYGSSVEIDDAYAVTEVTSDQDGDGVFETTWTLHQDYELGPDNADVNGVPWERIKIKPQAVHALPHWNTRSVKVTGSFGWEAGTVPGAVVTLTSLLAVRMLTRPRMAPFGVLTVGVDGAARIAREDPDMNKLIIGLSRAPLFI